MKLEKVGRNEWNALNVGEIGIFTLPTKKAKECARVAMSQVKDLSKDEPEGEKDFERVSWEELKEKYGNEYQMVVPDERLTLAYRRVK